MADRSVKIAGFPPSLNKVKLKLFIEKVSGKGTLDSIEKEDDRVLCTFIHKEGLQRFIDAKVTEYLFGREAWPLKFEVPLFDPQKNIPSDKPDQSRGSSPSPLPQKDRRIQKFDPKLEESLYSKTHYWNTLPQLPITGGTMCVLAQNISQSTSIQAVKLHFESKKRANGGPIAGLITMIDGLLVIFEEEKDCLSCSEMFQQKLGDKKTTIFSKMVPTYYERKFVIEGVGENTIESTLVMFLESCSMKETSPVSCTKQDILGVYLVEYGPDYDTSETSHLLQKIQSTPLEQSSLQAKPLLKTDCLKVSDIPDSVSNDQIKLQFESKKRTDGGPVTRIDRIENQSALVYFALFEDAERIFEKSGGSVIISQHLVKVQLYHHSLSKDHEKVVENFQVTHESSPATGPYGVKQLLKAFEAETKCDKLLLNFVLQSEKHTGDLKRFFQNFAAIEVIPQKEAEKTFMKFTPKKINSKYSQREFEEKCHTNLDLYLKNYSVVVKSFDISKLQKARDTKAYHHLDEQYTGNEGNEDFAVRWSPGEPTVEVIGLKGVVDPMIQYIEDCANSTSISRSFTEDQYKNFVHCGIMQDLRNRFKRLKISCDEQNFSVMYAGPDADVQAAQIEALTAMMTEKKKLTGIDEMVVKFLSESMQKSSEISAKIQSEMKKAGIRGDSHLDIVILYLASTAWKECKS